MKSRSRTWITDVVIGGIAGAVIAAIVAVNIVIYAGPDQGYESSLGEVFDHSPIVGSATIAVLVVGPVAGVLLARTIRRQRL